METKKPLLTYIKENPKPVISDGAMGTLLHQRGIEIHDCMDCLNIENPALVAEIHRDYIEAGAEIILTNTFGANHFKLERIGMEDKLESINQAGVDLVNRVSLASFKNVYTAGDLGPLGVRLAPYGRVQVEEARSVYKQQIQALLKNKVDLLVFETITDLYEIREGILAAKETDPSIPVLASMTFTRDNRTILGDSPEKIALALHEAGADIIGVNCSGGPNQILQLITRFKQTVPDALLSVKPNAGFPERTGGRVMYAASSEYFAEYALKFWAAGANIIGGCCGTTPEHIRAIHDAIQSNSKPPEPQPLISLRQNGETLPADQPSQLSKRLSEKKFSISVEMNPPKGLSTHKLLAGASLLAEAGAVAINISDSPMARMRMSPWAVCNLVQKKIGIETILHFPTRGRNLLRVQGDLLAAHAIGVRNVFVVMGDPVSIGDYPDAMNNFDVAPSGLIKLIAQGFNAGKDHSGENIGQPTSFFIGCALNLNPQNLEREIKVLKRKLDGGANFILTQPVYEPSVIRKFIQSYENIYGKIEIPMFAGLLPLASGRHAEFLQNEVPGIDIPQEIRDKMQTAGDQASRIGMEIAIEFGNEIKSMVDGIYIMPAFNRFEIAAEIIEKVKK